MFCDSQPLKITEGNVQISDLEDSNVNRTVKQAEENYLKCEEHRTSVVSIIDKYSNPYINNLALHNSTDVTFGSKVLYNGPITVNHYEAGNTSKQKTLGKPRARVNHSYYFTYHYIDDFDSRNIQRKVCVGGAVTLSQKSRRKISHSFSRCFDVFDCSK